MLWCWEQLYQHRPTFATIKEELETFLETQYQQNNSNQESSSQEKSDKNNSEQDQSCKSKSDSELSNQNQSQDIEENQQQSQNQTNSVFKCTLCEETMTSQVFLEEHEVNVHGFISK